MALSRRTGQRFQASIWPGFVDAMSGLLLVLFFVLSIFMVVQFVLRETISGQESELDQLAGEVAALAQALGLQEQEGAALQARVGELTTTLNDAERRIALLTSERDQAASALSQAETQITSFEAQVAALMSQRDTALDRVGALETAQETLLSEQDALNLALAQARDEVDAGAEAARLAAARREALEALIADLETRADTAEQALEARQQDLASAQEALSAEEAARLAEAAAAQALRERLANADTELTAMTLSLEAQRKEAEDTLTLLAAAQAAEADLDEKLIAALLQVQDLEIAQNDTQESARAAQIRADRLEAETRDLNDRLVTAMSTIQQLQSAQSTSVESASAAQTRIAELEVEVSRLRDTRQRAEIDRDAMRAQLVQALAAKLAAEQQVEAQTGEADWRAALLATAQKALADEKEISSEAQRQTALLNQQVAALRAQLGELQGLLDAARSADVAKDVQLQSLGSELNTALARVAAEERRRRQLEEEERIRLEAQAQNLERYRSEFFGQLRDLLGTQEGVRIVGDRFVFSSEVLFAPGAANLSPEGQGEIAKIATILQEVSGDIPEGIDWVLQVDGHTDNIPLSGTGQFADNWELSQARALSVVRYMVNFLGLPPDRLSANGFGQFQPINPADTPEARAQNRRIEIKFTEK